MAFPYEGMSLQHVEIEGDELDYADWGYEDYVNHKEDTTEKYRKVRAARGCLKKGRASYFGMLDFFKNEYSFTRTP